MTPPDERGSRPGRVAVDFGGAGLWVWRAGDSDPEELAKLLARNEFQYLVVKAHDGTTPFRPNAPHLAAYAAAARRHGLAFGLWGYLTAVDAAGEASFAAELVRRHSVSFYLADAEAEYERATDRVSRAFVSAFRRELPELPAGLSSFGRIDLHPGLDWRAWRSKEFDFHPQAYECESRLLTPAQCAAAARGVWPLTMIHPTLGAFEGARGRPSPRRLAQSLDEVETRGFSIWRSGTATPEDVRALAPPRRKPAR
jgi:hypothetical protein